MQRSLIKSIIGLLFLSVICFFFIFFFTPSASERYFGVSFRGTEDKQIAKEADSLVAETKNMNEGQINEYLKGLDAEDYKEIANFAKDNAGTIAELMKNEDIRNMFTEALKSGSDDVQAVLKELVH